MMAWLHIRKTKQIKHHNDISDLETLLETDDDGNGSDPKLFSIKVP